MCVILHADNVFALHSATAYGWQPAIICYLWSFPSTLT